MPRGPISNRSAPRKRAASPNSPNAWARSLPELLEAAAVYTATIEGMADFSRPHLLRQVNAASDSDDYSREDYLRSFGTLLRQGKIQKVQRGRFSVTEASTFMTEARRAAH